MKAKHPPEVQERIDHLDKYEVNNSLKVFHIAHLYPEEVAYPDGYYDSMFFTLVLFNTETMEKRTIGGRDGLDFYNSTPLDIVRIFADGSTLIRFSKGMAFIMGQSVTIMEQENK